MPDPDKNRTSPVSRPLSRWSMGTQIVTHHWEGVTLINGEMPCLTRGSGWNACSLTRNLRYCQRISGSPHVSLLWLNWEFIHYVRLPHTLKDGVGRANSGTLVRSGLRGCPGKEKPQPCVCRKDEWQSRFHQRSRLRSRDETITLVQQNGWGEAGVEPREEGLGSDMCWIFCIFTEGLLSLTLLLLILLSLHGGKC